MPDFKGILNLELVLFFIVPGLVIVFIRSRFITGRSPSHTENILSYLTLSLVYYAFIFPLIKLALDSKEPEIIQIVIWIGLTLFGPSLFGLLLGTVAQKGWSNWVAEKVGLSITHIIPTAWDWRFSTTPRCGFFVMVTLADDKKIAGFFGPRSFASSDPAERDLYLQEEYIVGEDGNWESRSEIVGIFIPGREIRYIEFWET